MVQRFVQIEEVVLDRFAGPEADHAGARPKTRAGARVSHSEREGNLREGSLGMVDEGRRAQIGASPKTRGPNLRPSPLARWFRATTLAVLAVLLFVLRTDSARANPAAEILDVIRWFGERGKIFNIHFRNIRGGKCSFVETFPEEGDMDMWKSIKLYRALGYPARALLIDIARQYTGSNNGRLVACARYLKPLGWNSNDTVSRALANNPLVKEATPNKLISFRITMGVRNGDDAWKRQLNEIIAKRRPDIDKVLLDYGVPLLVDDDASMEVVSAPRQASVVKAAAAPSTPAPVAAEAPAAAPAPATPAQAATP